MKKKKNNQNQPPADIRKTNPNNLDGSIELNKHPLKDEIIEKIKSGEIILQG